MAAEDVGQLPTHPRRRTPDHPPYAVMIAAAIRSLSDEGGSTMEAISRYIRSNYDDLPDGHDRLLPYYLSKLTAQGEFVMPEAGRFLVADLTGAEPSPGSRPGRAQPSPPSKPADNKEDNPRTTESPPAVGQDSDRPTESQNGEGSSKARPTESRLERTNEGSVESLEYVLGLPWEGPPVTLTANEGDGSDPVPKRRGRPPKSKSISIGDSTVDSETGTGGLDRRKDGNDGKSRDDEEPEAKRRGRPPKNRPLLIDTSGVGSETGGEDQQKEGSDEKGRDEPGPKRRGRLPKKKPVLIHNSAVGSETGGDDERKDGTDDGKGRDEPEPKRRGRPTKNKSLLMDNSSVGSATGGEDQRNNATDSKGPDEPEPARAGKARKDGPASGPKRRGRLPKGK